MRSGRIQQMERRSKSASRASLIEFVWGSRVMQVGLEDRLGTGQVEVGHDHPFDRRGAQSFIKISIDALLGLVEEHAAARDLIILQALQMGVGALHNWPVQIVIIRAR